MDIKLTKKQLFELLYDIMDVLYPNPKVNSKKDGSSSVSVTDNQMMHWFPHEERYHDYIFVDMNVYKQIRKYIPILSNDPNLGEFFLDYFSKICDKKFNVMFYDVLNASLIYKRNDKINQSDNNLQI